MTSLQWSNVVQCLKVGSLVLTTPIVHLKEPGGPRFQGKKLTEQHTKVKMLKISEDAVRC